MLSNQPEWLNIEEWDHIQWAEREHVEVMKHIEPSPNNWGTISWDWNNKDCIRVITDSDISLFTSAVKMWVSILDAKLKKIFSNSLRDKGVFLHRARLSSNQRFCTQKCKLVLIAVKMTKHGSQGKQKVLVVLAGQTRNHPLCITNRDSLLGLGRGLNYKLHIIQVWLKLQSLTFRIEINKKQQLFFI